MFCMLVIWIEVKLVGFCCYPHFNAKKLIGFTDLAFNENERFVLSLVFIISCSNVVEVKLLCQLLFLA